MKKIILLNLFILSFIFSGCGKVAINTDTAIKKNGEINITTRVLYDNVVGNLVNNEEMKKIFGEEFKVNQYVKDSMNVTETSISYPDMKTLLEDEKLSKLFKYSLEKEGGMIKDRFNLKIKFNTRPDYNENENYDKYVGKIPYNNTIKVPGRITNTNAITKVDENTVEWNYLMEQINEDTEMSVEYEYVNSVKVIIWVAIFILIIGGAIYWLKYKQYI